MMDSAINNYFRSIRKKRTFSEVYDKELQITNVEENKRVKLSRKEQIKELKLVQYFENLWINQDNFQETFEDRYKFNDFLWKNKNLGENLNKTYDLLNDDICIENFGENNNENLTGSVILWDENKIKSLLDYEKVKFILIKLSNKLFELTKNIPNDSNRLILKKDMKRLKNILLVSFLTYYQNFLKSIYIPKDYELRDQEEEEKMIID